MSLLLDALKKAADDKEKTSRGQSADAAIASPQADSAPGKPVPQPENEELSLQPVVEVTADAEGLSLVSDDELTLPEDMPENMSAAAENSSYQVDANESVADETDKSRHVQADHADQAPVTQTGAGEEKTARDNASQDKASRYKTARTKAAQSNPASYTISDAGLSLLIDKTNRDEKRNKRIMVVSIAFISLVILLSGGLYYYMDMQDEIAAIERKHQIAMQSMQLKTSREKTPDKSAIIRNLVSDKALEEKVEYAKTHIKKSKQPVSTKTSAPAKSRRTISNADLTIKKTNKVDPEGAKLDDAWLAYENKEYDEAKRLYKSVLQVEADNRDAQLGLAAIAVHENDKPRARRIYQSLLQKDPLDPIATAALAGMDNDASSVKGNTDYLLSLLAKNPDAPELNFSVGNNFAQQDRWQSAQQYYFRAWQLDADNADYIFNLAVSMDQLGKPEQAIGFYQESLKKAHNATVGFSPEAVEKRISELQGL